MARLGRAAALALLIAARAELLSLEVFVDGVAESLRFDRCASDLELLSVALPFLFREDRALAQMGGSNALSQSEALVAHMRAIQDGAGGDPSCDRPETPADELPIVWNWADLRDVAARGTPKVLLNFGGGAANDYHGFDARFAGYVGVEGPSAADGYDYGFCRDGVESCGTPWCLCADLATGPLPLPDASVDGVVSDHTFEHIKYEHWPQLLREFHRVLKVGAHLRVAVPDYHAPGDVRRAFWDDDARRLEATRHGHHALTNFVDMRPILDASPFAIYWLHYFDASRLDRPPRPDEELPFVRVPVDYTRGFVKRTLDHPGNNITSVVVDLIKVA